MAGPAAPWPCPHQVPAPRTRLRPAVSMTAFADAGFSSGTLLGASACVRFSTRKRDPFVVPPVQLGVGDQLLRRLPGGQIGLQQPTQQRVVRPGGVGETPVPPGRGDRGSAGRDLGQLTDQAGQPPTGAQRVARQAGGEPRGGHGRARSGAAGYGSPGPAANPTARPGRRARRNPRGRRPRQEQWRSSASSSVGATISRFRTMGPAAPRPGAGFTVQTPLWWKAGRGEVTVLADGGDRVSIPGHEGRPVAMCGFADCGH